MCVVHTMCSTWVPLPSFWLELPQPRLPGCTKLSKSSNCSRFACYHVHLIPQKKMTYSSCTHVICMYNILHVYMITRIMKSTKMQTLGELRMRGTTNWWAVNMHFPLCILCLHESGKRDKPTLPNTKVGWSMEWLHLHNPFLPKFRYPPK